MTKYIEVPDFEDVFKTAMTLFNEEKRPELIAQHPDLTEDKILKELRKLWKKATKEEKAPFDREATRQDSYRKRVYGHIKLPLTAYKIWFKENKEEYMRRDPGVKNRTLQKRMEVDWGYMSHEEKEPYFEQESIQRAEHTEACRKHKEHLIKSRAVIVESLDINEMADELNSLWEGIPEEERLRYMEESAEFEKENPYPTRQRKRKRPADVPPQSSKSSETRETPAPALVPAPFSLLTSLLSAEVPQASKFSETPVPAPVPFSLLANLLSNNNQPVDLEDIQPTSMAQQSSYPSAPTPHNYGYHPQNADMAWQQQSLSSESLSAPAPSDDAYQPQNPGFYWNSEPQITPVPYTLRVPLDSIEPSLIPGYGSSPVSYAPLGNTNQLVPSEPATIHYDPSEPVPLENVEPTFMTNQCTRNPPTHHTPLASTSQPVFNNIQPSFEPRRHFSPPATPALHFTPLVSTNQPTPISDYCASQTSSQPGPIPFVPLVSTYQSVPLHNDFSWKQQQPPSSSEHAAPVPNALRIQDDNLENLENIQPSFAPIEDFPWEHALQTIF
ncbi:hypothetical protein GCK72_011188 [Caenorhabditis remanei]|uniref:HMG box domain-containing protein n=1 Tax=Caenorhabditis remanei TaxID=31234 RepID=A0A6A5H7Z7_CAERE|nr:hypothetical protein GCK72_011188 [Caenorhabditis remanei]KAF1762924.1 hypothetical protein GCK72_011188 [Caenorhabditis remanei]